MNLMACAFVSFAATIVFFAIFIILKLTEIKLKIFDDFFSLMITIMIKATKISFFLTLGILIIALLRR